MTIVYYAQLNHVFRTRDIVKKNDAKLAKLGESANGDRFRVQGFTRPKVKGPWIFSDSNFIWVSLITVQFFDIVLVGLHSYDFFLIF